MKSISPIIQASELLQLQGSADLVIVDVSNGPNARANYEKRHLDGALFLDLNTQLAEIKDDLSMGGRHPLPDIGKFAETLAETGISAESHVIIYDDKNGSNAAARFWWMLKSAGHEKVQVLNGGFQEAEKAGFPINAEAVNVRKKALYKTDKWLLPLAEIEEVESVSQSGTHLAIDVRDTDRYKGITEPIDLIAGHIPGAKNVPFTNNLDENGLFLPADLLKKKYESIFGGIKSENIVVHCGSGVTACHTLLAIAYAGLEIPKLYVGSWSEWSRKKT